jgi:hypothetical protein
VLNIAPFEGGRITLHGGMRPFVLVSDGPVAVTDGAERASSIERLVALGSDYWTVRVFWSADPGRQVRWAPFESNATLVSSMRHAPSEHPFMRFTRIG